jgi:hypothetical protein
MPVALWSGNSQQTKEHAEERAGKSELGYLYRLEWCRDAQAPELKAYPILKVTPRGWRIRAISRRWFNRREDKMVYRDAARTFAKPTVAEAVESYIARKTYYRSCLEQRLVEATKMVEAVKRPDVKREFEYFLDDEPIRPGPYYGSPRTVPLSSFLEEDELV